MTTPKAEPRSTDALLADMDALLAEVPGQAPAPAPEVTTTPEPEEAPPVAPAPAPAPEPASEARGDEWEAITAPRPESNRDRTVHGGWQPRELPESLQPEPAASWPPLSSAPTPATPTAPVAGATAPPTVIVATKDDDQGDDDQAAEGDGEGPAAVEQPVKSSRSTIIATTVSEWRLPPKLGGRGWLSMLAYTGAAIALGVGSGFTQGTYVTLDTLPIGTAAVSGVAIAVGLAGLLVERSRKTFALFGVVVVLVLVLQYVSIPVGAGVLATLITWGLDQRARTMRQPLAFLVRALFSAVALATFALTWTTVVPLLTGATQ